MTVNLSTLKLALIPRERLPDAGGSHAESQFDLRAASGSFECGAVSEHRFRQVSDIPRAARQLHSHRAQHPASPMELRAALSSLVLALGCRGVVLSQACHSCSSYGHAASLHEAKAAFRRKKAPVIGPGLEVWRSALLLREGVTGTTDFPCFVYQTSRRQT
jgi:hypothetical protein